MSGEVAEGLIPGGSLAEVLGRAEKVLLQAGAELEGLAGRLRELNQRLGEGRLHLAVLGQFKRGKSTLLNALLGEDVLPTGVVPLTAVPTFISHAQALGAKVVFAEEAKAPQQLQGSVEQVREFIARFVSEQANPANRLGVSHVELTHPGFILQRGVVFIDTPGIGSTFKHNTQATLNFLPQCDAALVVLSADPPITEVEVQFLRLARPKTPRMIFVLNKVDYLDRSQREVVREFLERVLREQVGVEEVKIWSVSAKAGLEAKTKGEKGQLEASGLEALEQELVRFAQQEKMATLTEAIKLKAAQTLEQAMVQVGLMVRSLKMPLEELHERLSLFEEKVSEIEHQRTSAQDILAGERRRLLGYLEELAGELRARANKELQEILFSELDGSMAVPALENRAQHLLAEVIPGYFERASSELSAEIGKRMNSALQVHARRARGLVEELTRAAAELFEIPYHKLSGADSFTLKERPYWVTHSWSSRFLMPEGVIERLLPAGMRRRRTLKRLKAQVQELVRRNVENLRWSLYQSLNEGFRKFSSELDRQMQEALSATHGAIRAGIKRRSEHAKAIAGELADLERALEELSSLVRQIREC